MKKISLGGTDEALESKRSSVASLTSHHYRAHSASTPKMSVASLDSLDGLGHDHHDDEEERRPSKKLSAELSELVAKSEMLAATSRHPLGSKGARSGSSSDNLVLYRRQRRSGITFYNDDAGGFGGGFKDSMA